LELIRPPRNGFGKYLHAPGDAVQMQNVSYVYLKAVYYAHVRHVAVSLK
jgi:hypothetical protein